MQQENRRTQSERRAETRGALLQAARALFAEKGYAGTGTPEIVAAAGVTRGALYHHFADKTALFTAVVEQEHADVAKMIETATPTGSSDPVSLLAAGGLAFLAAMRDPGRRQILVIDAPAVLGRAVLNEIDMRHGLNTLICGLEDAVAAGALKPVPVVAMAHLFGAMFDRAATVPVEEMDDYRLALFALLQGLRA
ncbi:TetR/AcrR family transcriptional regulator [Devosia lacusdianchii]|uniref:TetR/AcrR family transcriptional regulator n=1 Tax=Devosia lacusdianchii TaxID=2917991 RepID=UPI001F06D3A9|nr:TetR/AcrR family transcriptional regulator [Devosia sp. JXJ CY 41]